MPNDKVRICLRHPAVGASFGRHFIHSEETNMNFTGTNTTAWLILLGAGLLEIVWSISMKASDGYTRLPYTALTIVAAGSSFWLLGLSLKSLPVGTAYAVWSGIGAVGATILGIFIFGEPANLPRLGCIGLIVIGILGLKLTSAH
jgi:quaternary ammonium compound-resistance protein SugE